MSALDDIESVAYRFEGDLANPNLVWLPTEASIGPDVLRRVSACTPPAGET